ncbi:MAG: 2-hydroxyacyl-CoA dehydratase family protein [Deltaproteobacteria bacterium]|uniref:hypothetical protein n=1 Tax=Candidatus Deferrimicrobium sp. TaxID=3060586 RepID=UPI00272707E5|nr:hypothetical protein [Candidatus Deferrimicrobium sp.]MCR4310010.1 2-hydroxyacyl-CoA dehydratase family protein [Deltaproteobacteria bacterium]MDO8738522.1 hypothetical protein [Candidatus Deferrimicrobium sp.]
MRAATISAMKKLGRKTASEEGVKGLLLEADHADPRAWSEAQAYNRLHAFMELFA